MAERTTRGSERLSTARYQRQLEEHDALHEYRFLEDAVDDWSVGATKSLLGAALISLERYEEAEALVLDARRDLEASSSAPAAMKATNTRPVQLDVAWGRPEAAATYRALLR